MTVKKIYGFTKVYKSAKVPDRHFMYNRKANRDAGVKLAKLSNGKLPPALKKIRKWTDKVRA